METLFPYGSVLLPPELQQQQSMRTMLAPADVCMVKKTPHICFYTEAKKIEVQNLGGFLVRLPQLASHAGGHGALLWCTAALVGGIKRVSWFTELWNGDTLCMEMKGNISVQAARARLWGSGGKASIVRCMVIQLQSQMDSHGGWELMSCCCINIKLSVTLLHLNTW